MQTASALTIDFSDTFEEAPIRVPHQPLAEQRHRAALAMRLTDSQIEGARATYVATGGNVSETARYHDLPASTVQRLSVDLEWPVYGTESAEKGHRQHMRKVMGKLEENMLELADSLGVERKEKHQIATMSKRELSVYLEPLSSRHSAFKTVFDAWMRLGAVMYPEDFAKDPDPANWKAQEAREQVRDLALLGGLAGIKRGMEDVLANHFVPGMPDRDREIIDVTPESDDDDA